MKFYDEFFSAILKWRPRMKFRLGLLAEIDLGSSTRETEFISQRGSELIGVTKAKITKQ